MTVNYFNYLTLVLKNNFNYLNVSLEINKTSDIWYAS